MNGVLTSQQTMGQASPWAWGQTSTLGTSGTVTGSVAIPVAGGAQMSP